MCRIFRILNGEYKRVAKFLKMSLDHNENQYSRVFEVRYFESCIRPSEFKTAGGRGGQIVLYVNGSGRVEN